MLDAWSTKLDSMRAVVPSLSGMEKVNQLNRISAFLWDKDADEGIKAGKEALALAEELGDAQHIGTSLRTIGTNYWAKSQYRTAEEYLLRSIEVLEKTENKLALAASYGNLSLVYDNQGRLSSALEYQLKSHRINEELKNKAGIISSANNLGMLYSREKEYEKALSYFQQTYDIQYELNALERIPYTLNNLGVTYKNMNNLEKAKEYFEKSLQMEQERKNLWGISVALYNIAEIEFLEEDLDQAIKHVQRAIEIKKQLGNQQQIIEAQVRLAFYLNTKGSLIEAEKLLRDALEKSREYSLPYEQLSSLFTLSENVVLQNNHEEGYNLLYEYMSLQDSIRTEEQFRQFNELRTQYELDIAENENELLRTSNQLNELEIEKKNSTIMFSLIGLGVVLLLILVILMNYQQKVRANEMLKQRNALIIQQKDALTQANEQLKEINNTKDRFFSIMAHDIKNPLVAQLSGAKILLNHIESMDTESMKKIAGEIQKNTFHLLGLLNNLLQWSRLQMKRIKCQPTPLIVAAIVHRSFELYGLKARNKEIQLNSSISPDLLVLADRDMLITVMNNLISNAIKFSNPRSEISVFTTLQDKSVTISVKDRGIGMTKEQQDNLFRLDVSSSTPGTNNEKGTGLGLILIRELIQQNNGTLILESEVNSGTTVSITLPVFNEPDEVQ